VWGLPLTPYVREININMSYIHDVPYLASHLLSKYSWTNVRPLLQIKNISIIFSLQLLKNSSKI